VLEGGCRRPAKLMTAAAALLAIGLVIGIAGGCGDDQRVISSTSTVTVPAGGPTGEIEATVSVSSTNGAYPADAAPDWSQIKSAEAFRNASYGVATIWVSLATYEVTAATIGEYWDLPYPAAGQGRIELGLTRTLLDTNEPPLVTGTYDLAIPQGEAELTGWAKILLPGGTAVTFDTSSMENDVQVTALSDTQISGTFFVKDKWSEISGTFTAPIK